MIFSNFSLIWMMLIQLMLSLSLFSLVMICSAQRSLLLLKAPSTTAKYSSLLLQPLSRTAKSALLLQALSRTAKSSLLLKALSRAAVKHAGNTTVRDSAPSGRGSATIFRTWRTDWKRVNQHSKTRKTG